MTQPDCVLTVGGVRFADTRAAILAGEPTALAELSVRWGRDTTVDQPEAGSCKAVIADRSGGSSILDSVIDVGSTLTVTANGDVASGPPANVVQDGGFETLPTGTITNRVATSGPDPATSVVAPVHGGARAVAYDPASSGWLLIPPQAFHASDPTVWDDVPRYDPTTVWTWSLAVRADYRQHVTVTPVVLAGPTTPVPGAYAGVGVAFDGDLTWHVLTSTTTVGTGPSPGWLGLRVDVGPRPPWTALSGAWNVTPGTWNDYRGIVVDDAELHVPPGPQVRPALVFAGEVTDLKATLDIDGALRVEVTAVDQLAQLENRGVGDVPWPAESLTARVGHVLTAAGVSHGARIDPPLGASVISYQDADNQPAGSLLAEYSRGVDGVLWSATHATTGPYMWIENPLRRAQLGELQLQGSLVVIVWYDQTRGTTHLDACLLPIDPITWVRDVSDVITRVEATWSEQTLDDKGQPAPTDRHTMIQADAATVTKHGVRRYAVTTHLTTQAAAQEVCQRIINRSATLAWRLDALQLDLALTPPETGKEVADVLDLLDGTTRLGRALIVDDATMGPSGSTFGAYLEGGSYSYEGAWRLELDCSPHLGMGASAKWNQLDPTWTWNMFDPTIRWFDLWGVAP